MKTIQSLSRKTLVVLLIGAVFTGCGKSNNGSGNNGSGNDEEGGSSAGADNTFDVTLVNKADAADVIEYADALPIDEGRAIYRNRTISEITDHSITLALGEVDEVGSIFGIFDLDDKKQPFPKLGPYHLEDGATLTIRPEGTTDYYISISGTATFSDLKYALPIPSTGAACFTLKFEGDFEKYTSGGKTDDIYQGSGAIVVSPQDDMGTYKAP